MTTASEKTTGETPACLFCRIVRREIPGSIVHEDDEILAFRDIAPAAPTHILVIPKRHIRDLASLAEEDAPLAGRLVTTLARLSRDAGLSDFRLAANNGRGAGQSVFHLHFHLLGGRPFSWPPG